MNCNLCPKKCNAKRTADNNIGGFCNVPYNPKIARAALHFWEEPCISGKNGSGTVFFSGCSLACVFCQNFEISRGKKGVVVTPQKLADIFRELEKMGAHNINLVTPDHYVLAIKEAFEIYKPNIPIVYNSSGYVNTEQLKVLEDYIDIYLMDFKYISNEKAKRYSSAQDYPTVAKEALKYVYIKAPVCEFDENGMMTKGVIGRHLLLPLSTKDAMDIFDFVKIEMPNSYFSIMSQYVPINNAEKYSEINRKVTRREYDKVTSYIVESGFENCFIQELSSADIKYIPEFEIKL